MTQVFEGHLFISSGCEHGPEIMAWNGKWNKKKYEELKKLSWCDNEFSYALKSGHIDWNTKIPSAVSITDQLKLIPGKKYRLTIEEIKEPEEV